MIPTVSTALALFSTSFMTLATVPPHIQEPTDSKAWPTFASVYHALDSIDLGVGMDAEGTRVAGRSAATVAWQS
jgi:hypothetical protein